MLYIIYLGHKPHDDRELITDSHHDILGQVIGSKEEAKKHMVYSYRHGFSGFAAKLTNSQAKQMGEIPGVIRVIPNQLYKKHTSRSWDFLGLSKSNPNNLLNKTNQGEGIIIGIIDSGIWGDSEAFNDKELGPIPSRWKGSCKSEGSFNATKHCNKKIIGARWYIKGAMEELGLNQTMMEKLYNLSPLDEDGHGTHVAYTAAGSYVNNIKYYGLDMGTTRGGAPHARLAIYKGQEISRGKDQGFAPLLVERDVTNNEELKSIVNEVKGKVLMLFLEGDKDISNYMTTLNTTGVLAVIGVTPLLNKVMTTIRLLVSLYHFFTVDVEQGNQILDYFQQCKSNKQDPMIKLGQTEVLEGNEVFLKVAKFSSRGPNSFAPEILKPDVAAPGVDILAAFTPNEGDNGFQLMSGTSMAAPQVSGIVALLKVAHPDWSPAAIKSALVTTAWNEDTYKSEIYSEGTGDHLANPFDFGGGICNPNGAMNPGLIYDMDKNDYLNYLCSLGYNNNMVRNATSYFFDTKNSTICPNKVPSTLDMNLPSISIPNLKNSTIVKRIVTNVGDVNSVYKLVVKSPKNTVIKVSPNVLNFNSKTKKISFEVKIISTYQRRSKFNFGSLAWSNGKNFVRIPIAVRKV